MNRRKFLKLFVVGISSLAIAPKVFAKTDAALSVRRAPAGIERSSLDVVNNRRIVLAIKKSMEDVLIYHRYDLNDVVAHSSIQDMMNSRLEILQKTGMINDYAAICNDANNPPIRIDQGYTNLDVSVILSKNTQSVNIVASMVKDCVSISEFV